MKLENPSIHSNIASAAILREVQMYRPMSSRCTVEKGDSLSALSTLKATKPITPTSSRSPARVTDSADE